MESKTVIQPHRRLVPGHVLQMHVNGTTYNRIADGTKFLLYRPLTHYWFTQVTHGGEPLNAFYENELVDVNDTPVLYKQFDRYHIINGIGAYSPDMITGAGGIRILQAKEEQITEKAITPGQWVFAIRVGQIEFNAKAN